MEKSRSLSIAVRGLFVSAFLSTIFGAVNASAYTVTFNANGAKFEDNSEVNIVTYDNDHNIESGEYKEPTTYTTSNGKAGAINGVYWVKNNNDQEAVRLSDISEDIILYAKAKDIEYDFDYIGDEEEFIAPLTGRYIMKAWGASGGGIHQIYDRNASARDIRGGYGGFATGDLRLANGLSLYMNIGGSGQWASTPRNTMTEALPGGYNGGGSVLPLNSGVYAGSGGGATSVAFKSGLLKDLSDNRDSVVMVAGGGGGAWGYYLSLGWNGVAGSGGGYKGNNGNAKTNQNNDTAFGDNAATQTGGYAFGQGESNEGQSGSSLKGSGGGGWFGGHIAYQDYAGGNGGSGYIGGLIAETRHMTSLASGERNNDEPTKTMIVPVSSVNEEPQDDILKIGNGYVKANYHPYKVTYVLGTEEWEYYVTDTNQKVEEKNIPRAGYELTWRLNDADYDFDTPITEDIVLTGEYSIITYNLSYDLGAGVLSESNLATYTVESDDITLNNPTAPDYYTFLGWSGTGLTGDRNLTVIIPKGSIGNREYTANIAPTPYTITYNLDGGTNGANNPTEYNYESNEIVLARPTKEGYTFLGWSGTGIDGEDNLDVTIPAQSHGDREYTAHWSINQYTATFDVNGGSAIDSDTITSNYGVAFGTLPETAIVGYEFLGWFTEQTGGTKISDATTMPAEDHTYYAHWEIINCTIEYDLGGADMDAAPTNDASNPTSYTVNDSNITLGAATPGDSWHYFVGWALDRDTEDGLTDNFIIDTSEAKNIKVYAIFQANPYTVTIDPANGEAETTRTVRGDQEIGELPTPTKDGYDFLGWFYGNKQVDEHFHPRSDARIVAHWEEIPMVPNTGVNSMPDTGDAILDNVMAFAVGVFVLFAVSLRTRKAEREI